VEGVAFSSRFFDDRKKLRRLFTPVGVTGDAGVPPPSTSGGASRSADRNDDDDDDDDEAESPPPPPLLNAVYRPSPMW